MGIMYHEGRNIYQGHIHTNAIMTVVLFLEDKKGDHEP